MKKETNRSQAYFATVKMVGGQVAPEDQATLDGIKMVVKMHNTAHVDESRRRVKLQGRGPRSEHSAKDYNGRRRCYDQSLPLKYATHADVYVYSV
jgi:hypothetical protein